MAQYMSPPSPLPQFRGRSSLRSKTFWIPAVVLLCLISLILTPLPRTYEDHRDAVVNSIVDTAKTVLPAHQIWHPTTLATVESKYAFATFLAGDASTDENWDNDHYFIAARILAYQLLHAPETASRDKSIPFIVLVTENVSEEKRQRLRKDGAIVVLTQSLHADWVKTETSTWQDVMTKLRLWELTQFERIAFLDGDSILVEPLDGVFQDPAVARTQQTSLSTSGIKSDEGQLPTTYCFAGVPEMNRDHAYPPSDDHHDFPNIEYLNAGFFVFQPSVEVFNYYISLLSLPGRFDPTFPEQNLMNYAHRKDGNMPWTQLGTQWNIHYPKVGDLLGGVKSLHEKWWQPESEELRPYMESWRWRMEGFFESQDLLFGSEYSRHGLVEGDVDEEF